MVTQEDAEIDLKGLSLPVYIAYVPAEIPVKVESGKATDPAKAERTKRATPKIPVFIGSGITAATIGQFLESADGFIVGTALKCPPTGRPAMVRWTAASAISEEPNHV